MRFSSPLLAEPLHEKAEPDLKSDLDAQDREARVRVRVGSQGVIILGVIIHWWRRV